MVARFVLVLGIMVSAGPALAGTKAQMNIVPTKADCFTGGGFCLNNGASCGTIDNSDCVNSSMSASSKFKIDGTLVLKGSVKKVTDNTGALITTGAEGADDNLIFKLSLNRCVVDNGPPNCHDTTTIYIKVVLNNGNGKMNVDLSAVLAGVGVTSGDPLMITGGGLLSPPIAPNCAGTNSSTDITARLNDSSCEGTGGVYGAIGFAAQ